MAPQPFPKFRHAQKNRGPYHRGKASVARKATPFWAKVVAASAAVFGIVLNSDQVVEFAAHPVAFARNLERETAAPAGAYYSGCDAARAAGVAPIYADEPGYRDEMDGDGDGVACEPYHRR